MYVLNVLCSNIRRVNTNIDELFIFLENSNYNQKVNVIVLTETWHDVNYRNINVPGYKTFYSEKKTKMMVL